MRVQTFDGDYAEGVVIVPATNSPMITDDLSHIYTYNADGTLATDTCTGSDERLNNHVWQKTYTYTNGQLTAESPWVVMS
jgi:hypothetical protein